MRVQDETSQRTFTKLVDARRWIDSARGQKATGEWRDPRQKKVTFGQWVSGPQWTRRTANLRPSTQAIYRDALRKALPIIGHVPSSAYAAPTLRPFATN